jgi:Cys-tRNA(Pro) deacylase
MAKDDYPVTPAIRFLREHGIAFTPRLYSYEDRGGTRRSAQELGVDEHIVIKTLVMESGPKDPFLVLMHGDCEVSVKQLARELGARSVAPASEATATRATGYQFGGTSPFGTRTPLPVLAERSIFALPLILINGGKRGLLVEVDPQDLKRVLAIREVEVAVD